MLVGICTLDLHLSECNCLKDKRRIIKSVIQRTRNKFNVAMAEVDNQELWRRATLGITSLSTETGHLHQMIDAAVKFVEVQPGVELLDFQVEVI